MRYRALLCVKGGLAVHVTWPCGACNRPSISLLILVVLHKFGIQFKKKLNVDVLTKLKARNTL